MNNSILKLEIEQFFLEKLKLRYRFDQYPFGHKTYKLHTQMINNIDEKITFLDPKLISQTVYNPNYNPTVDWFEINKVNIDNILHEIDTDLQIQSIYQFSLCPIEETGLFCCFIRFKEKK